MLAPFHLGSPFSVPRIKDTPHTEPMKLSGLALNEATVDS